MANSASSARAIAAGCVAQPAFLRLRSMHLSLDTLYDAEDRSSTVGSRSVAAGRAALDGSTSLNGGRELANNSAARRSRDLATWTSMASAARKRRAGRTNDPIAGTALSLVLVRQVVQDRSQGVVQLFRNDVAHALVDDVAHVLGRNGILLLFVCAAEANDGPFKVELGPFVAQNLQPNAILPSLEHLGLCRPAPRLGPGPGPGLTGFGGFVTLVSCLALVLPKGAHGLCEAVHDRVRARADQIRQR
eukprot:2899276-Prymnesium_polylepis.1